MVHSGPIGSKNLLTQCQTVSAHADDLNPPDRNGSSNPGFLRNEMPGSRHRTSPGKCIRDSGSRDRHVPMTLWNARIEPLTIFDGFRVSSQCSNESAAHRVQDVCRIRAQVYLAVSKSHTSLWRLLVRKLTSGQGHRPLARR